MEKLLELLSESTNGRFKTEQDLRLCIEMRGYCRGFIKWLVENDKIDFSLIPNKIKEIGIPIKINGEIKYGFDSSDYYWLLMLLAIQDEPIRFLCEIIK